jgi:hypothetical protein
MSLSHVDVLDRNGKTARQESFNSIYMMADLVRVDLLRYSSVGWYAWIDG